MLIFSICRYLFYHQGPQSEVPWRILKSPSKLRSYLKELNKHVDPSPSYIINLLGQLRRGISYALELRGNNICHLLSESSVKRELYDTKYPSGKVYFFLQ